MDVHDVDADGAPDLKRVVCGIGRYDLGGRRAYVPRQFSSAGELRATAVRVPGKWSRLWPWLHDALLGPPLLIALSMARDTASGLAAWVGGVWRSVLVVVPFLLLVMSAAQAPDDAPWHEVLVSRPGYLASGLLVFYGLAWVKSRMRALPAHVAGTSPRQRHVLMPEPRPFESGRARVAVGSERLMLREVRVQRATFWLNPGDYGEDGRDPVLHYRFDTAEGEALEGWVRPHAASLPFVLANDTLRVLLREDDPRGKDILAFANLTDGQLMVSSFERVGISAGDWEAVGVGCAVMWLMMAAGLWLGGESNDESVRLLLVMAALFGLWPSWGAGVRRTQRARLMRALGARPSEFELRRVRLHPDWI